MGGRIALVVAVLAALAVGLLLARDGLRRGALARGSSAARAPEPAPALGARAGAVVPLLATADERSEPTRESVAPRAAAFVLGALMDPGGKPVSEAEVTLFDGPLFADPPPRACAVRATLASDADGRFRFAVATSEGRFGVRVAAVGFVTKSRDQSPDVDVPFELVPAVRVRGRILGVVARSARRDVAEAGAHARICRSSPQMR